MKHVILVFFLAMSSYGFGQFTFTEESEWKKAYEMIALAKGNKCDQALEQFDILHKNPDFKHRYSFGAISKCFKENGRSAEADSILQLAKERDVFGERMDIEITHPELKEKFLIMYLEDQGAWTADNRFVIDPGVRKSMTKRNIDIEALSKKLRKGPYVKLHNNHVKELDEIVAQYGFPTKEMVGYDAMGGVKLVILHSKLEVIEKYEKDFSENFGTYSIAYLIDKARVAKDQKQLYGTQGDFDENKKMVFYPIEDEVNVNKRRMEAGMDPLEVYAKLLGVKDYTVPEF